MKLEKVSYTKIMMEHIKPYGFVKEHKNDYLKQLNEKYYVYSHYACGLLEITEKEFERLAHQGMEIR